MSKFEFKIVLALLVASMTPLIFAAWAADKMVRDAFDIALNPEIANQLQHSGEVYREFFAARKGQHRAELLALARETSVGRSIAENDQAALGARLTAFLDGSPHARTIRAFDAGGSELARVESPPRGSAEKVRTVEIAQGLVDADDGPLGELRATFTLAERYLVELEQLEQELQTVRNLAEAQDPIRRGFLWTFVAIVGAVILGAAGIGILLSRRVTRRINALVQATRRIGTGDLDFALKPLASDEIGDLTREFNSMIAELRESRSRIQYLERISAWQGMARRLAHEIKNPLTPIQLAVEEVARQYPGDDKHYGKMLDTALEVVHEEVGVLRALVKEFSDFARLPEVKPVPTDLQSFVEEVVKSYAFDESVSITIEADSGIGDVPLDRVMIKTALDNLILNAAQAASGSAEITIALVQSKARNRVTVEISDRGSGITDELKGRLFDPYFTTKESGTGLGLAITKKVILDHRGQIEVLDNPGGGAVFRISLPRSG